MIISKRVYDPTMSFLPNNRAARTNGLYGHTAKFWNCKKYDFFHPRMPMADHWTDEEWNAFCQKQADKHKDCRLGIHESSRGYLRYIGKRKTYTLFFFTKQPRPNGPVWFESSSRRNSLA